jgi:multicomponent K+:H+ antiporter subunit G
MILDILITLMLVVGGVFGLVGSFGLVRLPDAMTRLHAPTKATTLGVGGVLIASMLYFAGQGAVSAHELLISLFLFLTAPITAHFIAKAHLHLTVNRADLPPTGTPRGWAGFTAAGPVRGTRPEGAQGAGTQPAESPAKGL